ncbi:MAG: Flp pilus assembly complex ATPase component TadA, partial [Rubrivivax sp.]|nr:Flp pilus assembly complex ATPase component TadA [Rubrivivax sp.]
MLDWLQDDGWIAADDVTRVARRLSAGDSSLHPLVRLGGAGLARVDAAGAGRALDVEALTEWLAGRAKLPYLRIDPLKADVGRVAEVMPVQYAESRRALPFKVSLNEVVIATAEPFDTGWVAELQNHLRKTVKLVVANPDEVRRYTTEFYALSRSVRAAQKTGEVSGSASFEQLVELGKSKGQLDANDQGVVQVVDWLWQYAFDQRASDIHLEPRRDIGAIRFRIDGVLHTVYQVPLTVLAAMTSRIKLLGRMDVVEKRRPLDGRIKTRRPDGPDGAGGEVEMRLSTLPTAFGEKMVMRIFDPQTAGKSVDQ